MWLRFGAVVVVLLVVAALTAGHTLRRLWSDPVLGTPGPAAAGLSSSERSFVSYVEPRLTALSQESANLAAIGEARGRDAVALLEGQRHVETLIAEVSKFIEREGVPERFVASATDFRAGARLALQGIRDGRSAFTRLDWDALADAVETTSQAGDRFQTAAAALTGAASGAATGAR
jgi:YD repeat-containing protein